MASLLEHSAELEAVIADEQCRLICRAGARTLIPLLRKARLTTTRGGKQHEPESGSETSRYSGAGEKPEEKLRAITSVYSSRSPPFGVRHSLAGG